MLTIAGWNDQLGCFTSQIPTVPGQVLGPFIAAGAVRKGYPVSTASGTNRLQEMPQTEDGVSVYQGFAVADAADGDPFFISSQGLCAVFAGLSTSPAVEHFVYGPLPPVPYASVPAGAWCRCVGTPVNASTINLLGGVAVMKKPSVGTELFPMRQNGNGHFEAAASASLSRTGTAGQVISAGVKAVYRSTADGKLYLTDGIEANVDNFQGLTDGAAYALNATVTYYPPGSPIEHASLSALDPGDVYAKDDGTLFDTSNAAAFAAMAGKFSRIVLNSQGSGKGQVVLGEEKQL